MTQAQATDSLFLAFQLALAGRYSIDRELGRGGMGIVYLAREVHLDRLVAIKLLPPERLLAQQTLRERFLREARLAAKLSHPNIIPIHAVEETGGFVYYVMAYVEGETLAERVRSRGPLTSAEGTRVLREAAWALAYAHAQGVVHRDVKPDNILLETSTGRALVADFGIAAAAGDSTSDGVVGTPEFMSPEQALGRDIDARSDLYALGATAFYMFSGRVPFEGATPTEVLARQVTAQPPALASLGLTVPRKLAALVDRCLAKDREQRPASAQLLAEQLSVALEQRREVPAALRAFVKRSGRLDGGGTLIAGFLLLPAATIASAFVSAIAGYATFGAGVSVLPLAYMMGAARKLIRMGFTHQDLEPAFRSEVERGREEIASERHVGPPSLLERIMPKLALASSIAVIGGIIGVALSPNGWWMNIATGTIVTFVIPATVTGLASLVNLQRRTDLDTAFWSRVWLGPVGKAVFALARRLRGKGTTQPALTHRATELSLGLAAEQLYDALPKDARRALGDLPTLLRRLQDDAQSLRQRQERLLEALADAGDAASLPHYADVRAIRDEVQARLRDVVGALETIRLNLLRLHAGSATVEGLTTHLGLVSEVSDQVERLIAAQDDVERALRFPRTPTPTPA